MERSFSVSKIASLIIAVALMAAGCANVSIRKVDESGQASGPDGIRFYMPRPYIGVNEPFIIASRSFLVSGRLSPDTHHVLITNSDDDLSGHFKSLNGSPAIPASQIHAAPRPTHPRASVSTRLGGPPNPTARTIASAAPEPTDPTGISGQSHLRVANDNDALALTPFKRYFDIYWLPDFDEQYVVSADAGLANADTLLTLGQGWSFQGLDATIDNSAITERLLALYDSSIQMLSQAARTAILGPAGALLPESALDSGNNEAYDNTDISVAPGTPMTLRVTICRLVAPGLYPILKPGEISGAGGIEAFTGLAGATPIAQRILVPIPPLTNIAFNTYEIIVVEAARADADVTLSAFSLGP